MAYFVGIDLGGTNIKAGVVSDKGELLNKVSIKTNADRPMEDIITDMGKLAKQAIEESGI
ncbi:MAG TPA: glucokinase, partial [Clostridiales bacterium]|nr:glucokinase [Clostridiales bacterium]